MSSTSRECTTRSPFSTGKDALRSPSLAQAAGVPCRKKKTVEHTPTARRDEKTHPNPQFIKKHIQKNVRKNQPPPLGCCTHAPRAEETTYSMHYDNERMIHEKDPLLCP